MGWRRRRAQLPTTQLPQLAQLPQGPLGERRARAQQRAWSLMATSIPTRDILRSYLDDILTHS
jgi:hypothetical protein